MLGGQLSLWGKRAGLDAPYPLVKHLLDTVAWGGVVWDYWLAAPGRAWAAELLGEHAREAFRLLAGLHDLGKADPVFQHQLNRDRSSRPSWLDPRLLDDVLSKELRESSRHEAATGAAVAARGCPLGAVVLAGHHGRWAPEPDPYQRDVLAHYRAVANAHYGLARSRLIEVLLQALGLPRVPPLLIDRDLSVLIPALAGAVTVADWLASDEAFVHGGVGVPLALEHPGSYLARRSDEAGKAAPDLLGRPFVRRGAFSALFGGRTPRGVQTWTDRVEPSGGLTVLMVPPGEGKTEAALQLHARLPGEHALFFGLPSTATADAMFERVQAFYGNEEPTLARLAHGRSALHSFYDPTPARPVGVHDEESESVGLTPGSWFRGQHRALAAPVTVGTSDQALAAALSHRYVTVRLASLSTKHVVLDEVHTYDPYQQELLVRLLGYLGAARTPVTLLSATLPSRQLRRAVAAYADGWCRYRAASDRTGLPDVAPYPGVVTTDRDGRVHVVADVEVRRRYVHRVQLVRVDADRAQRARQTADVAARLDGRVGVVVNTVDRALAVAHDLQASGIPVLCLHSRMTASQRDEVTQQVLARHGAGSPEWRPPVLVGTQVVETSLDLDLDHLVSDLAPASSLVQRSGRQWRHSEVFDDGAWNHPKAVAAVRCRADEPVLHVLGAWTEDDDRWDLAAGSHLPYFRGELRRTLAALRALPNGRLRVPGDVQELVDRSYVSFDAMIEDDGDQGLLDDVMDQVAEDRSRARRALEAGVDARELRRSFRWGAWEGNSQLHRLTQGRAFRDDAVTRLTYDDGGPAERVLLLDPAGTTPHAYAGDVDRAQAADERSAVLEVLRAVVPVGGALGRRLRERCLEWDPPATVLRDVVPVRLADVRDLVRLTDLGLERAERGDG